MKLFRNKVVWICLTVLALAGLSFSCARSDESFMDFWFSNEVIGEDIEHMEFPYPDRIIRRGEDTTILRYLSRDSFFDVTVQDGYVESLQFGSTRVSPDWVLEQFLDLYEPDGHWIVHEKPFLGEETSIYVRKDKKLSLFKNDQNVFVYRGEYLGDQAEIIIPIDSLKGN
ncbi:MAG: hypothetical protein JJU20_14115 [Opitutales bacterium]|nr:hypothetical protein [Opitutales bacterium]